MHFNEFERQSFSIIYNTRLNNLLSDNSNKNECSSVVDAMLKHFLNLK